MHRSGTSAIAKVMGLLGGGLPKYDIRDDLFNKKGHWESRRAVRLNDDFFLNVANCTWYEISNIEETFSSQQVKNFDQRIKDIIKEESSDEKLFILKDPRLCRLIPLWADNIKDAGFNLLFVCPIRNPLDVALSLKERNRIDIATGTLLWSRYVLDAEMHTRQFKRSYVRYEDLLDNPERISKKISNELTIKWPTSFSQAQTKIEDFLDKSLCNNRHSDNDLFLNKDIPDLCKGIFRIFSKWASGHIDREDINTLKELKDKIDNNIEFKIINNYIKNQQPLKQEILKKERDFKRGERSFKKKENNFKKKELSFEKTILQKEKDFNKKEHDFKRKEQFLTKSILQRERMFNKIISSTSWKITAPFRFVADFFKKYRA